MLSFCYFYIFIHKEKIIFSVSLYKELLEPTLSLFPYFVLDNLWKIFQCSVITDFISTMFGFSKGFGI